MFFREDFSEERIYTICEDAYQTDWKVLILRKKLEFRFETWFYNNPWGVMTFVFGSPESQFDGNFVDYTKFALEYVEKNFIRLSEEYRKEYMN